MTRSLTVAALEKLIPVVLCWKCSGCNTLFTAAVGGRLLSGSLAFGLRHQISAGERSDTVRLGSFRADAQPRAAAVVDRN